MTIAISEPAQTKFKRRPIRSLSQALTRPTDQRTGNDDGEISSGSCRWPPTTMCSSTTFSSSRRRLQRANLPGLSQGQRDQFCFCYAVENPWPGESASRKSFCHLLTSFSMITCSSAACRSRRSSQRHGQRLRDGARDRLGIIGIDQQRTFAVEAAPAKRERMSTNCPDPARRRIPWRRDLFRPAARSTSLPASSIEPGGRAAGDANRIHQPARGSIARSVTSGNSREKAPPKRGQVAHMSAYEA